LISGKQPVCSGKEGLLSAAVAAGIELARINGEIIDMEERWDSLLI
jgi:hypothetical protein